MPPTIPADPLAQSDREERITTWLEGRHMPDAWKIAPALADAGVDVPKLESLACPGGRRGAVRCAHSHRFHPYDCQADQRD